MPFMIWLVFFQRSQLASLRQPPAGVSARWQRFDKLLGLGKSHSLPSLAAQAAAAFPPAVRITASARHVPPRARFAFSIAAVRMAERIAGSGAARQLLPTSLASVVAWARMAANLSALTSLPVHSPLTIRFLLVLKPDCRRPQEIAISSLSRSALIWRATLTILPFTRNCQGARGVLTYRLYSCRDR
jgi:hypothetical protein